MEQRAGIIEKDIGNAQINQAMGIILDRTILN